MTILYTDIITSHMQSFQKDKFFEETRCSVDKIRNGTNNTMAMSVGNSDSDSRSANTTNNNTSKSRMTGKRAGKKPGRKPAKIDERAKLERSRQSAKECRARKKLRYQYLEELVLNREKAVFTLREELETFKQWCIQLDRGSLPDALIKMIANEEMARQRKQAEDMQRAAQIQSQRRAEFMESTSSARISMSSSSSSSSPSPPHVSGASSHPQLQQQQKQFASRLPPPYPEVSGMGSRSILTRQMAFDNDTDSNSLPPSSQQYRTQPTVPQQKQRNIYQTDPQQTATTSFDAFPMLINSQNVNTSSLRQNLYQQQNQSLSQQHVSLPTHQGHSHQLLSQPRLTPRPQQYQQQQAHNPLGIQYRSTDLLNDQSYLGAPSVKSEPTVDIAHQPSLDDISDLINQDTKPNLSHPFLSGSNNMYRGMTSTATAVSGARMRSLSNPVTMTTERSQPTYNTSSATNMFMATSIDSARNEIGLFSGIPLSYRGSSATTIEDSDSSDDNANSSQLFQSSASIPNKRTLSDPSILQQNKKARSLDSEMDMLMAESFLNVLADSNQTPAFFNAMGKQNNASPVNCMGSTGTLNTPSASPFGLVPRNTDSPMTTSSGINSPAYSTMSGNTNITPSSSKNPSPAPCSLSSFLEHSSSSLTFPSAMESEMEHSIATTCSENFLFPPSHEISSPVVCSETGLSATISEPIPEWYSFLADLHEENSPAPVLGDTNCLRSNNNTVLPEHHFLYSRNQGQEQSSVLNVPTIIEELSSDDSV